MTLRSPPGYVSPIVRSMASQSLRRLFPAMRCMPDMVRRSLSTVSTPVELVPTSGVPMLAGSKNFLGPSSFRQRLQPVQWSLPALRKRLLHHADPGTGPLAQTSVPRGTGDLSWDRDELRNGYLGADRSVLLEFWSPFPAREALVESQPAQDHQDPKLAEQLWEQSLAEIRAAGVEMQYERAERQLLAANMERERLNGLAQHLAHLALQRSAAELGAAQRRWSKAERQRQAAATLQEEAKALGEASFTEMQAFKAPPCVEPGTPEPKRPRTDAASAPSAQAPAAPQDTALEEESKRRQAAAELYAQARLHRDLEMAVEQARKQLQRRHLANEHRAEAEVARRENEEPSFNSPWHHGDLRGLRRGMWPSPCARPWRVGPSAGGSASRCSMGWPLPAFRMQRRSPDWSQMSPVANSYRGVALTRCWAACRCYRRTIQRKRWTLPGDFGEAAWRRALSHGDFVNSDLSIAIKPRPQGYLLGSLANLLLPNLLVAKGLWAPSTRLLSTAFSGGLAVAVRQPAAGRGGLVKRKQ
eukprot:s4626_g2.t1